MQRSADDRKHAYAWMEENEQLLDLYRQMLIVAYAKMRNKADALDIVQESWIKILMKLDTLQDQEKRVQWAKAIVSNTAKNAIKRKVAYDQILREHADSVRTLVLRESPVERYYEDQEVLQSLQVLDEDTRKMFLYKFYYNWKDREIAEALGFPLGTVKARIHRGKRKFRRMLEMRGEV